MEFICHYGEKINSPCFIPLDDIAWKEFSVTWESHQNIFYLSPYSLVCCRKELQVWQRNLLAKWHFLQWIHECLGVWSAWPSGQAKHRIVQTFIMQGPAWYSERTRRNCWSVLEQRKYLPGYVGIRWNEYQQRPGHWQLLQAKIAIKQ